MVFRDPRFTLEESAAVYEACLTLAAARVQTPLLIEETVAVRHHAEFGGGVTAAGGVCRSISTRRPAPTPTTPGWSRP